MTHTDSRPSRGVACSTDGGPKSSRNRFIDAGPDSAREGGRRSNWDELWTRYSGDLVRYTSHLLSGDVQAAEDVAQETALRLWQHPDILDDGQPIRGWLRTVARNIVIDLARRRRARPTEVALVPGIDAESPEQLGDIEATATVSTILARLTPRYRDVIYEVYVRDRPVVEVAAALGIPPGTVKSRCHAALYHLRTVDLTGCR
jgi:RNA polymerase sigma-70 factor, ECF subfamily